MDYSLVCNQTLWTVYETDNLLEGVLLILLLMAVHSDIRQGLFSYPLFYVCDRLVLFMFNSLHHFCNILSYQECVLYLSF